MKKTIKFDNMQTITVITKESPEHSVSANDAEMDKRAREAVRAAINHATTCKKPIAMYDKQRKQAYIATPDGEKKYV